MLRRATIILLAFGALAVAGLLMFAHLARTGLADGLTGWAAAQRQRGWVVQGQIVPSVWSAFAPVVELRNVRLQGGDDWLPGGVWVSADRVQMRVDFWRPAELHVAILGKAGLGLVAGGGVNFTTSHLDAVVTLTNGGKVTGIAVDGKSFQSVDDANLSLGILDANVAVNDQGAQLDLRTEALVVPQDVLGLGQHLSDVTLNAALHVWPPLVGSRGARADIWRASGGSLEISRLVVGWGPLGLIGQGHLGLDGNLQPDGAATLQVRGYQTALERLGGNAAMVGNLLAQGDPADATELDLRFKKNTLSVDRIPVVKLQPIKW